MWKLWAACEEDADELKRRSNCGEVGKVLTQTSRLREIRVHTGVEHRVVYVAKFEEAVYVLHAFEKRTRKTRQADIDLARRRYAQVLADRSPRTGQR